MTFDFRTYQDKMSLIGQISTRFGVAGDTGGTTPVVCETTPVVSQTDSKPEIESKAIITHCKPWCDRCGGWQAIETVWTDGRVDVACRTCRAVMPDRPTERKPKAKNDQQTQEVDK
jgi:hypothetical protein